MPPRFCVSSVGASDAVASAWRTYAMLYGDEPREMDRGMLRAYVHRLVIKGERNQDQLTVRALIYLKKQEHKFGTQRSGLSNRHSYVEAENADKSGYPCKKNQAGITPGPTYTAPGLHPTVLPSRFILPRRGPMSNGPQLRNDIIAGVAAENPDCGSA